MTEFVIIGAGDLARILVDALRANQQTVMGYVSPGFEEVGRNMRNLARLGDDNQLLARGPDGIALVNGIGSTGIPKQRRIAFEMYHAKGFRFAQVVHPSAVIAQDVYVGEGAQIMAGAIIQTGTRIGVNALINTGALIDHDVEVGDHAHVAPGARLSGAVRVGTTAMIGIGATVIQRIQVGEQSIVGAGAVVVRDVLSGTTVVGVPARPRINHGGQS